MRILAEGREKRLTVPPHASLLEPTFRPAAPDHQRSALQKDAILPVYSLVVSADRQGVAGHFMVAIFPSTSVHGTVIVLRVRTPGCRNAT